MPRRTPANIASRASALRPPFTLEVVLTTVTQPAPTGDATPFSLVEKARMRGLSRS